MHPRWRGHCAEFSGGLPDVFGGVDGPSVALDREASQPALLGQQRERRAFVDQLGRLVWLRNREHVGVNADMMTKWERGDKQNGPGYRELFSLLFGVTADYLGIGLIRPTNEVSGRPVGSVDCGWLAGRGARRRCRGARPARAGLTPLSGDCWGFLGVLNWRSCFLRVPGQ